MRLSSRTAVIIRVVGAPAESDNVRLVRRMYEAWNARDREAVSEIVDSEVEYVNPENAVEPGIRRGHEGLFAVMDNLEASFDKQDVRIDEMIDLGDRMLCHVVFRARGRDSGADVEIPEQHLWTFRDGKILRLQWFHDRDAAERAAQDAA
jgi:ketosteroid isomerase-like protein